jgi:hypothetical protein
MGAITPEMRERYGYIVDWLPQDVLSRIDQDEVLDRLDAAQEWMTKAAKPGMPADLFRGYIARAQEFLKARPRAEVETEAQRWTEKAEKAFTPQHASACISKAIEVRTQNAVAPRRVRPKPKTPEQLRHEMALKAVKADLVKAEAAAREKKRQEDAEYAEQLAGRRPWTVGAELRYRKEQGR